MGKRKVFLYGYYGFGNFGDDLLLQATIKGIVAINPDAEFVIRNLDGIAVDLSEEKYRLTYMDQILVNSNQTQWGRIVRYLISFNTNIKQCKTMVLGGGTVISGKAPKSLLLLFLMCLIAKSRGVQIYGIGMGLTHIESRIPRYLCRGILRMSKVFCLRDQSSYDKAISLGRKERLKLTADLVYAAFNGNSGLQKATSGINRKVVALSITPRALERSSQGKETILEELATAIVKLHERNWRVKLIAFQDLKGKSAGNIISDKEILTNIAERTQRIAGITIEVVVASSDMNSINELYDSIDVMIGMRFHGLMLAAIKQKPFVGFAHDPKIADICNTYHMPLVMQIDADHILSEVERAMTIRVRNQEVLGQLVQSSEENFQIIAKGDV